MRRMARAAATEPTGRMGSYVLRPGLVRVASGSRPARVRVAASRSGIRADETALDGARTARTLGATCKLFGAGAEAGRVRVVSGGRDRSGARRSCFYGAADPGGIHLNQRRDSNRDVQLYLVPFGAIFYEVMRECERHRCVPLPVRLLLLLHALYCTGLCSNH